MQHYKYVGCHKKVFLLKYKQKETCMCKMNKELARILRIFFPPESEAFS